MTTNPSPQPPKIGVWRAVAGLGDYKLKHLLWPEGLLSVVLGIGGAVLVVRSTTLAERVSTAGDLMALAGALLAVVFAALAIVVSLPSSRYLRMLEATREGGMRRFLDPFLVALGTQIALLLGTLAFRLLADDAPWWVEHAAFYVIGFLLVFGLLDVAGLARSLVRHGIYRALDAVREAEEEDGRRVARLDQRRTNG